MRRRKSWGRGKRWRGEGRRAPARPNSPLAAGTAKLRPLFATLENGLGAPANAGICPGQVTLQILGLGEWRSGRHGSGEGGETARRRRRNAGRTAAGRWGQNRKWRRAFATGRAGPGERSLAYRERASFRDLLYNFLWAQPRFFRLSIRPLIQYIMQQGCYNREAIATSQTRSLPRYLQEDPSVVVKNRLWSFCVSKFEFWFHNFLALRPWANHFTN